jgi:hypothetical protein
VEQIPNGSKNQCMNCHLSMLGGYLNPFGQEIYSNHLSAQNMNGNVKWSSALAAIDSDGDGYSNGQELFDPNGIWKIGDSNPGNQNDLGNPGNSTIIPVSLKDLFYGNNLNEIVINSINPNPIKESFEINFSIIKDSFVEIELFDLNGRLIAVLFNSDFNKGSHQLTLFLNENIKHSLLSGNYFLTIRSNESFSTELIKVVK